MTHSYANLAYRHVAASQSSPVGTVIALYDGLHEKLCRAIAAMHRGAVEERAHELKRGFAILTQLHALLDMEGGGITAANLNRFYEHLRREMMRAQFERDIAILQTLCDQIHSVRDAWKQVESREIKQGGNGMENSTATVATPEYSSLDCSA